MDEHAEQGRSARFGARLRTRLALGALIGCVVGAIVGLVVGVVAFRSPAAILASFLAGVIGLGGIGAFWGGMSALESPDPSREPLQSAEPLAEPPTRVEGEPPQAEA
ncbi:MAG TPA: hypothetical protein VF235_04835 [Actinomycetota bacterium]